MTDIPATGGRNSLTATSTQLISLIKAHIAKGDKAKEKADDHYIAAGQYLKQLKDEQGGTWDEWETLLKTKIGIGKSRASELMQIADGRKTVESVREETNERKKEHRTLSPFRNGENADAQVKVKPTAEPIRRIVQRTRLDRELDAGAFDRLRDEQARNEGLAEKLRAAEIKIVALEGEVEDLKRENAELRKKLAANAPADDGLDIPDCLRREPKAAAS